MAEGAGTSEELVTSYIGKFTFDVDTTQVHGVYLKEGHGQRKLVNRENVNVVMP